MARQQQPKPTGSNVDDFVFSYGEDDISQFLQPIQQVQTEQQGFLDKVVDSGKAIFEGLPLLPGGIRDTVSDVMFGFDPNDEAEMARRREKADEQTAYAKKYAGKAFEGVTDAMTSMPYSLATMGSALGAGALASTVGPIAAGMAGMAASGTSAYRATVAEFERTMYGAATEALGRKPTDEEWGNINSTFSSEATKYGFWEAGPEAISNLFMVKILGPLGSRFKGGAKGLIKKVAGVYGEELATETITQMGQGSIESDLGMRDAAPSPGEAFTEIAPATFWQTTLMAGGKKGLDAAYRRKFGQPESDTAGPLIDEPAPQGGVSLEAGTQQASSSEFGELTGPKWDAPAVAPAIMGADQWNREAAARGWNHFRDDIPPTDTFLSQNEYGATDKWVKEHGDLSTALNKGETVDLLSWRGVEENPVYMLDALPPAPRREALPMAGVHGALGLPAGSGAMPMGTRQSRIDIIAPPTAFAGLPVATPYVERLALPEQSTTGTAQGRWAGGRSQLAYGKAMMGVADALGMGNTGMAPQPVQAIPTQSQITSVQHTPRADTTAQAQALGMPSPQTSPQEGEREQSITQLSHDERTQKVTQVAPSPEYASPSGVGAQYGAANNAQQLVSQQYDTAIQNQESGATAELEKAYNTGEIVTRDGYTQTRSLRGVNLDGVINALTEMSAEDRRRFMNGKYELSYEIVSRQKELPYMYGSNKFYRNTKSITNFANKILDKAAAQKNKMEAGSDILEKMSRTDLLAMLPKDMIAQARRLDKPAIRERIRKQVKEDENAQAQIEAIQQPPPEIIGKKEGAPSATAGETLIGVNSDGKRIFVDKDGVRSVEQIRGVRVNQNVEIIPTRDGVKTRAQTPEELYQNGNTRFLSSEEVEAFQSKESASELSEDEKPIRLLIKSLFNSAEYPDIVIPFDKRMKAKTSSAMAGGMVESHQEQQEKTYAVSDVEADRTSNPREHEGQRAPNASKSDARENSGRRSKGNGPQNGGRIPEHTGRTGAQDHFLDTASRRGKDADGKGRAQGPKVGINDGRKHGGSSRLDAPLPEGGNGEVRPLVGIRSRDDAASRQEGRVARPVDDGRERKQSNGVNYNAPVGTLARIGSWKEAASRNLDIIELSKKLDAEKRPASPEEQALLAQYVGWGPGEIRNKLFPTNNRSSSREINVQQVPEDWKPIAERAKAILSPKEVEAAFRSTQYAHYTSEPMIRSIWDGIARLGFEGGKILEPGMGSGLFAVASPSHIMEQSRYTGVEMDKLTARIAGHLLPEASILSADFVKQKLPDDFFDLAIGNPPFAATKILDDPRYKKYRFMLHDYFFAKALDKIRPGGMLVFVTSKGTMDKGADKARAYMAERADLLGAVRLPQTAFKQNAGTEVVTDVLFLRKRQQGESPGSETWQGLAEIQTPEGPALINEYFARHPEMVLGSHSLKGSMYRSDEYTVLPHEGESIDAQFAKAIQNLPEGAYSETHSTGDSPREHVLERDFNPKHKKEGGVYIGDDGGLHRVENGSGVALSDLEKLSPADVAWMKDYVTLRDALKQAQYDQLHDGAWEQSLHKLNTIYDNFAKKHGRIQRFTEYERTVKNEDGEESIRNYKRYSNGKRLSLDIEGVLVNQLEDVTEEGDIVKANFLKERTIKKPVTPEIKSIQDALMVSLDQRGHLDIAHIAELAGEKSEKIITQLGDAIFEAPGKGWEMADAYLSGDVVTKLEEAEAAAKIDAKYARNVSALLAVQPKPIAAKDILVDLGATWVPVRHINDFAKNIVGTKGAITFNQDASVYTVSGAEERSRSGSASEWGTPERSPEFLLSAALNNRSVTVRVKTTDDKLVVDPNATAAANEKISKIREAFSSWIWQDKERVEELTALYNRSFNNLAPRTFDGTHLTLPGLSLRYKLYDHQKRAIWRIVQTGNTYLAHAVGAGKTLEMIVSGMEQRRLGLIKRPMYVVPNHMLGQFSAEFQDAYPLARIMVATETNFHTSNRRRFVAQAALNDPDAIVITHSAFGLISTKPETTEEISREFMEQLEEAISESSDRISRSKLEQRLEQAQRRMDARMNKAKDQGVYFEDMGVDFLYVDEAHEFRKLDFVTNRDKVKGVDPNGSERSLDLFSKLAYLRKQNPTRSHVLASGTPVTNTMAELYSLMRYMAPEMLEGDGLNTFDAWASMFGRVKTELEQNAAGKYEFVERFSKFVNVPELMKRVRSFMDVLTMSQLGDLVQRPELIGGNPANVVAQASDDVVNYLENVLAARIEKSKKWKPSPSQKGNPDPMVSIITDGRLAALDMRFVSNIAKDDPQSKLNLMIDDIIATYHGTSNLEFASPGASKSDPVKGATQIVFSAVGFGEQVAARRGFDLRSAMMQRFKDAGISAKEVAWMGDYKTSSQKGAMFADMRAGKVRILIGSPKNMGTGVNVQKRLAKLHYLSPPWYPADVEQPHGRILRQGNQNKEVAINWYATKGTYDSTMWGMVARKARFIEQAFTGDDSVRSLDDISESSQYEMAAALAAGDERAIQLAGLHSDIERLTRLKAAHADEQRKFKRDDHALTQSMQQGQDKLEAYRTAHKELGLDTINNDSFSVHVGGTTYNKIKEAGEALTEALDKALAAWTPNGSNDKKTVTIGKAMGTFPVMVKLDVGVVGEGKLGKRAKDLTVTVGTLKISVHDLKEDVNAQGLGTRLLNKLNGIARNIELIDNELRVFIREQEQLRKRIGVPFPQEAALSEKIADAEQIKATLAAEGQKNDVEDVAPEETNTSALASIFPGEFLPPRMNGRGMNKNVVQHAVSTLFNKASAAAPVRVVQHFNELPEHVRKAFDGTADSLEGAYDPQDKTVYLVADNITDAGRVADVWVHEQVVHHGLRSLLSAGERQRVMNRLWLSSGGMGNATIASIARRYGMNPVRNSADRAIVVEEYLASLAEKKREGLLLSPAEKSLWRRFVNAISKLWNAFAGSKNSNADIEGLLTALGQHVMGGLPQRNIGGLGGALASLDEQRGHDGNEASGRTAWEQVQQDTEEWGQQLDDFSSRTDKRDLLTVCRTPDVLQKLGAPALPMTITGENLGKAMSEKEDHSLPAALLRQLPTALAEPVMIFESASKSDAFVVLTELKHEERSVMVAVQLDRERQRIKVNDIASAYKRKSEVWYIGQIEAGRLLYQDKKKSLAWARTNRLQLPKVRKLPARLSGKSILTEEEIVKPLAPERSTLLASLMDRMTGVEKSLEMVKDENIAHFFPDKTDLTMVQRAAMLPHWIAKKFPQFGVIYKRQLQRMDERNADKEKSLREIPSLFDAKTVIKGKDMDDLRKLIWDNDGKEISELKDTPKFLDADILANGRVLLKENPEWHSVYEQWLAKQPGSDKAKEALLEVRKSLDGDLMRAHNRMAAMSELSDSEIVQHRTSINHQHNYFPHHRYGQYYVQAKVGDDVVFRLHFDAPTRAIAKKRAADFIGEQRKNFPRAAWRADENEKLPDEIYGAPLDPEAMEQVIKTAAGRISNKEQAEKVRAALQESIADTLKIRGWGSHALHRKGIPGHEEQDILRVLYDYKSGLSGWLTKLEAARDFTEALGKIDARHHPTEWSYASQYVKDMLRNYDKIDRITGNIKSVAFVWYLGANLKTAAVNLTQNLIIGIPRLQMETVGGTGYLAAAQAAIMDQVTGRKGKGLTAEEGQLMREMYDNAVITDGYMEEVRGRVNGIDGAVIWNKLLKGMGWPMSVAERFNRASLALAAFRAAREGNLKATVKQEHGIDGLANYTQAKEYAEMIVRDAHYVYGKANMPEVMRSTSAGRMLSPAYTFRSFSHNTLGLWHWALTTQGKDGAEMVAKSLASTLLIGGIASAPFFATAMALYQAASGDDDDWMEEVRGMVNNYLTKSDMLRDIICYGLPSLAGVNLGGSLKMETPFSQGMKKGGTPKEIMTESMGDIIGIPYDLFIQRPSKIMEAYRNRNTSRMVEEAMPSFVQNMMRSYRLSTEGQKTMSGRDINEPGEKGARKLTQLEAVGKLLGFQPVSATKSYDRYSARQHADKVRSDKAGEFAAKMLKAREEGSSSAEVRQDMREWNARIKEDGKPWMMIKMEDVQRRMSARRRENRLSKRERPRKAVQAQIWE